MSGPKTSRYTLTPEQRRIFAEQRRIEQKTREEQSKIKRNIKELKTIVSGFGDSLEKATELRNRTNNDRGYCQAVEKLQQEISSVLNKYTAFPSDLTVLEQSRKALDTYVKQAVKSAQELDKQTVIITQQLKTDIRSDIDKGFSTSFSDIDLPPKDDKQNLAIDVETLLSGLAQIRNLPQSLHNEIKAAKEKLADMVNKDFLQNFKAMTVTPLEKKCKLFIEEYQANIDTYNELRARYEALCEMRGLMPKETSCSAQAVTFLEQQITDIEFVIVCNEEQAYISKCMDDVMEEMGYDLLGDRNVVKKSGKRFRNELYAFSEGTAVNVTYASDGKITMELGGVDTLDRLPTEDETKRLCEDMESFCDGFKEIEKRLLQKGIMVGSRISILPPSVEYAQIINADDYELKSEIDTFSVKHENRKESKHKTMQNEG